MLGRFVRMVALVAGWLVTPIAAMLAAALGATIGALVAPRFSPVNGVILAAFAGVVGAGVGVWLWLRLIRRSPNLQAVLAITESGAPREDAVDDIIGSDDVAASGSEP